MAPSGKPYDVDWVVSNNSNVHIANHRDWFTTFTPFETKYSDVLFDNRSAPAFGVGTVELKLRLCKKSKPGRVNYNAIVLHNVLYAPDFACNLFGFPESCKYGLQLGPGNDGQLLDANGDVAGLIEIPKLPRLWLHGRNPKSSLNPDVSYIINAHWPQAELDRFNAHVALQQLKEEGETSIDGEAPYTKAEKAWSKKHYGSEFKFLQSHGLSIYKEEDRTAGRAILRSILADQGIEEVKATKSKKLYRPKKARKTKKAVEVTPEISSTNHVAALPQEQLQDQTAPETSPHRLEKIEDEIIKDLRGAAMDLQRIQEKPQIDAEDYTALLVKVSAINLKTASMLTEALAVQKSDEKIVRSERYVLNVM